MKNNSFEELSRAYWRLKFRSIAIFFLALILWLIVYGGTLSLIVRWMDHRFPKWLSVPLGLGFLLGGLAFGMTALYLCKRNRVIRCPHCNEPVGEIQGGEPNPMCERCGKSVT